MSKSRSEIFVLAEGVDIICSLADVIQGNECIYQIIYILSELINATNFTRNKLKSQNWKKNYLQKTKKLKAKH